MAHSGRLKDYLGIGLKSERPALLDLTPGALGVFYATDEPTIIGVWNGAAWVDFTGGGGPSGPTNIAVAGFIAGKPLANERVFQLVAPEGYNFPIDLVGSAAKSKVASSGAYTFSIKVNEIAVGQLTFAASAVVGTFTAASAINLVAGDILSIDAAATPDANLADISITFKGTL